MLAVKHSRSASLRIPSSGSHISSKATYASVRNVRRSDDSPAELEDHHHRQKDNNDFIMSILRAKPSLRDSKNYLASFGRKPTSAPASSSKDQQPTFTIDPFELPARQTSTEINTISDTATATTTSPILSSILEPVYRRTSLVKFQGPFTDRQLASICQGMVYLEKLGLVSVVVVEDQQEGRDGDNRPAQEERAYAHEMTMRVSEALERQGAKARPILHPIARLGPKRGEEHLDDVLEAHTLPEDLISIRDALKAGEIPVLPPLAVDSSYRVVRIEANHVLAALARGMTEVANSSKDGDVDLTPLRLMIINREGGIPSYARSGLPHLLINLDSEYDHIRQTFQNRWWSTNPSALSNLKLARTCLSYMPPRASAIIVSHRSRSSLIANLITNKPAISSSLPHALLQGTGEGKLTADTPTLLRRGLPIQVAKHTRDIDKTRMTHLLERSFNRTLNQTSFYTRLEKSLDCCIIAGDYAGAAIITREPTNDGSGSYITYLDKFAVLPEHQGDGTVDFLWVALHDETYGLGLPYSVNPNGGKQGAGEGQDLVWRSRANNPINKWYFERSSGHIRLGEWVMFWCDAEKRLKERVRERAEKSGRSRASLSYVEGEEVGRMERWAKTIQNIPSAWA